MDNALMYRVCVRVMFQTWLRSTHTRAHAHTLCMVSQS